MRIGFVGATGHVDYVTEGLPDCSEIAVAGVAPGSPNESVTEFHDRLTDQHPDTALYGDHTALLDAEIDLAVVACHNGDLAARSREALERDLHVFTEKPVATMLDDLKRVREAHAASEGTLAAMFGTRYEPWFLTAAEHVRDGTIGEIRLADARKSYILGERDAHYWSRETYGGTIAWVGIHAIDWVHWLVGCSVETIRARHSTQANDGYGDLESTAIIDIELAGEIFAAITVDYLRPETAPTHGDDRLRLVGTDGIIEIQDRRVFLIDGTADGRRELPQVPAENPFVDFVEGLHGESTPCVTAEEAFRATETALHARNAADADDVCRIE